MQSSIRPVAKKSKSGEGVHLVRQQYRKDYKIPLIPYQEYGVATFTLWPKMSSVVRIVPGYDPVTNEIFRQNINCDQYSEDSPRTDYLSDTFHQANIVNGTSSDGRRQVFTTDYEPGSDDAEKWGGNTLLHVALRDIFYSVSTRQGSKPRMTPIPEWSNWCNYQNGTLKLDKPALLFQALAWKVNNRTHKDGDDNDLVDEQGNPLPKFGVVIIDSRESIRNTLQVLVEPANRAKPLDALSNSRYGGFAELDGIKMFFDPYTTDDGKAALRADVQAAGNGYSPEPFPLEEDDVRELWIPWEKLLSYMTADEQCRYMANEFGADTVNYVIGNDRSLRNYTIPEDIAAAGFGRYARIMGTASMTAAPSTVTVSVAPAAPKTQAKAAPSLGLGRAMPPAPPAPAPQPKDDLSAVKFNGTVDREKLKSTLAGIRAAAGIARQQQQQADEQRDQANELLDDTPLTAFDGQEG